jgi:hypothetical protein
LNSTHRDFGTKNGELVCSPFHFQKKIEKIEKKLIEGEQSPRLNRLHGCGIADIHIINARIDGIILIKGCRKLARSFTPC